MDQRLQNLKEELRSERCPPQVIARVREQIAREKEPAASWSRWSLAGATAVVVLLLIALQNWPTTPPTHTPTLTAGQREQVVAETEVALAWIAHGLRQGGYRTGDLVKQETLDPLRAGLNAAKENILN